VKASPELTGFFVGVLFTVCYGSLLYRASLRSIRRQRREIDAACERDERINP